MPESGRDGSGRIIKSKKMPAGVEYSRQASFVLGRDIGFEKGIVTGTRLLWIKSPVVNKKILIAVNAYVIMISTVFIKEYIWC